MQTAYIIVAGFLALALVSSAIGKLVRAAPVIENLSRAGVTERMYPGLAAVEVIGGCGLLLGIWLPWMGIAAAIGVILYFIGAVGFHIHAKDPNATPAVALGLFGAAALVLRVLSF